MTNYTRGSGLGKPLTTLEQLLEEINFQRTKELRQLLKDDSGFVMLHGTTYWTDLFVRHFLFQAEHAIDSDDLLFFVRKKHVKASSRYLPKFETEVNVFRKDSKKLPIGDPDIDWEETVYLNLVIHQFDYTLTLAICTRTSPKELQVLRRHSRKVYASPSRRRMDTKGDLEEMTYPHICFMVDNFDEVFCDILVRDGEMVCVELVASDREGAIQGVIFLGSIRYDALKKVYDARSSLSTKMAQRMTFGLFSGATSQRVEFVRMKGPQGKGHAEMAVTKPKGSGAETPTSEPGYTLTDALWDTEWDDAEEIFMQRHQRRLSDPSANLNNFVRGGWRTKPDSAASKARSENEGLDSMANELTEVEAGDVKDVMKNSKSAQSSPRPMRNPYTSRCSMTQSMYSRRKDYFLNRDQQQRQQISVEVGSETLVQCDENGSDKIIRQKISNGSILVQGEEEHPLMTQSCHGNIISEKNFQIPAHIVNRRHQRVRSRSLVPKEKIQDEDNDNTTSRDLNKSTLERSATLPRSRQPNRNISKSLPPHRVTPDGTAIYYWCELPTRPNYQELDDGAYNPLWTMRGFTQTFHFWKESRRAQSVPLNAFLTYITLPWWSIAKDILDHREGPILTF